MMDPKSVIKNTPSSKAHITRRLVSPHKEPHPAIRTASQCEKKTRRVDISPLPRSRMVQKPLGLRSTKAKSTWQPLLHGYHLEQSRNNDRHYSSWLEMFCLKDTEVEDIPDLPPVPQYDTDMDCGYNTMCSRFAYYMSGGVFGCPPPPFSVSVSSTNAFSSSTASGSTALSLSDGTVTSRAGSPPGAAAVSGSSGSVTVGSSKLLSSGSDIGDAPAASTNNVAATYSVATTPISAPSSSQPPKPTNVVQLALPTFTGLSVLPSIRLKTEAVPSPQPVAMAAPFPNSQSSPPVENIETAASPPSVEDAKRAVSSVPAADNNAPTGTPRAVLRPRSRPVAVLVQPKDAPKAQVELGMGAFSPSNIQSPEAQISAFSSPHFKQLFADEIKELKARLRKQEDIRGSDVIFLTRSLKWITNSHEAGWFDGDIELEDDVADWRGKLNILIARLETYRGPDTTRIAANTRVHLEKVFVILGGADDLNQEIG